MNLSTSTPLKTLPTSASKSAQRPFDRSAVIENDWVPAIQLSTMQHAEPVRRAGPLRPMWYVETAKTLMFKVVRPNRQTA